MDMNAAHVEELLSAYLEGDLDAGRIAEVEAHLALCPDCASLFEAVGGVREGLAAVPEINPPSDLLRKLYAVPERRKFRLVPDFLLRPSLQPVFAGVTGLLVFFSFLMFSPDGRSFQKNVARQVHTGYSKAGKLYARAGAVTGEIASYKNTLLASLREAPFLKKGEE